VYGRAFYAAEVKTIWVLSDYYRIASLCGYGVYKWAKHGVFFSCGPDVYKGEGGR
jgi:hypothetical protein